MAANAATYCGSQGTPTAYYSSGVYTSTVLDSEAFTGDFTFDLLMGLANTNDEENTLVIGWPIIKLMFGIFTSTVLDSVDVSSVDTAPTGISQALPFSFPQLIPWSGGAQDKLHLSVGFSTTLEDSEDVTVHDNNLNDIAFDGTDTQWVGNQNDKLFKQSGVFTSTVKASFLDIGVDLGEASPSGCGYDTESGNSSICGSFTDLQFDLLGFSTTVIDSEDRSGSAFTNISGTSYVFRNIEGSRRNIQVTPHLHEPHPAHRVW